jgi:hypothetical protein
MPFCSTAVSTIIDAPTSVLFCDLIEKHLAHLFQDLSLGSKTSAEIHVNNLSLRSRYWSQMRSNLTCLFCIRWKPEEHVLTCGHSICDVCPRILGYEAPEVDEQFTASQCILCRTNDSVVAVLQPSTANLSILSIDGGGICGVILLEFLRAMQELIETPLQDLFDFAIGTSSGMLCLPYLQVRTKVWLGGLIVIGFIIMGWDIYRCIETFDALARRVFCRPPWFNGRFWGRLRDVIRCVVSDGVYDAATMERTLMDVFGNERPMFGYIRGYLGKKALVTATDAEDLSTVAFATYNGVKSVDKRHSKCSDSL